MGKSILVCSIAFLLVGCGKQLFSASAPAPVVVDPILAPYVAVFEQNTGTSAAGVSVQFADTSGTANPLGETVGECTIYKDGYGNITNRVIQIDPSYWATIDESQQEQVVAHELGHCVLFLGHTPGDISGGDMDGCPISIMNPYSFSDSWIWCFTNNPSYYWQQLKSL
jgi:hypothetical protein